MAAKAKSDVARAAPVALTECWTAAKREGFLAALIETANVAGAARLVGVSELWRGRRGTEWAVVPHAADTTFVMVEAEAALRLSNPAAVADVRVMAVGVGDVTGVIAVGPAEVGTSVRPLSPVAVTAVASGGDRVISWTRRSRDGWRWRDAIDVPIGEENERYRVAKSAVGQADVMVEVTTPNWTYGASERAADLAAGASVATISIVQIGALNISRATTIIVPTI